MQKFICPLRKIVILSIVAFIFIFAAETTRAQRGNCRKPVTLSRLIAVLQNKSFNTKQIVETVNDCGADFRLTPNIQAQIVAAGARPSVIEAVRNNYRKSGSGLSPYHDLVSRAIDLYNADVLAKLPVDSARRLKAIEILNQAVARNPTAPDAYQQLGFMSLYGTSKSFDTVEAYMRKAIDLGGSAVFRVFHDHTEKFTDTCRGSLYISRNNIEFESDNNVHTFNTSIANVDEIKIDNSSTPLFREKHSTYKIILRTGGDHAKFRFAPLTGSKEESKMVERLIRGKL